MGTIEKYINKIVCADTLVFMKKLPDNCVDLVVTDPPYLIEYKTNHRKDRTHQFTKTIQNDNNPNLIKEYIKECYRILKDNTAIYMFCGPDKVDFFKQEIEKYFKFKNLIVWDKGNWSAGDLTGQFGKTYEFLIMANKGRRKINGYRHNDIWKFSRVVGTQQIHQNQKPVELLMRCIESHSNEKEIVFDGFLGSGSTAIAALKLKRNFIGVEIEEKYCLLSRKRIEEEING